MSSDRTSRLARTFWSKIRVEPNGCWIWTGSTTGFGYGRIYVDAQVKQVYVHRWAYELFVGPIPEGLDIDHVCHNEDKSCLGGKAGCRHRLCANPDHLRTATRSQNIRAGRKPGPRNVAPKPQCKWGHDFDEANTYIVKQKDGRTWRMCRKCNARRQRETHARKRAARA